MSKTIGTTTLSATGGSVIGGAIAAIILYFFPADAQVSLLAPLTIVISAVCALAGGYLAPSKADSLRPYLDQATEDIAGKIAAEVPSKDEVAEAVVSRTSSDSYTGSHAAAEVPAVEPGFAEAYPDLEAMSRN